MHRAKTFFGKAYRWWIARRLRVKLAIFAVLAVLVLLILKNGNSTQPIIETVKRQDLVRSVAATGSVVSTTDLALSFQESNLVRSISVKVGQKVHKGQVLATLSNASEAASVEKARGEVLAAQARYQKVLDGESGEVIRQAEVAVENAKRKLLSDDLVAEPDDSDQTSTPPTITGSYSATTEGSYSIYFSDLLLNHFSFKGIENGQGDVDQLSRPLGTKGLRIAFEGGDYNYSDKWSVKIPNTSGAHYVTNLNTYKDAVAALNAIKASARNADLDAARADVVSAQGVLAAAQAEFETTVIRAPSNGTITKIDLTLGELAEKFSPVITLQDVSNLYIEASVNESNISNIAIGQPVSITYDAFGKEVVTTSTVTSIDIGATVVDGIVNYKIKVAVPDPTGIRSGMTANLTIQTASAPQVLVIPDRVIEEKSGTKTVEVLIDARKGSTETRAITTGLRGDGGLVEVTGGLSEGEQVVFKQK